MKRENTSCFPFGSNAEINFRVASRVGCKQTKSDIYKLGLGGGKMPAE